MAIREPRESHSSEAQGLWDPAQELQPKQEPRSSDPPAGSILPGLFQFSLLQGQGHSQLAESLPAPSTGTLSLPPVSSF